MIYEFMPTQSYNGYDKPWAGGDGVNIFDETAYTVSEISPTYNAGGSAQSGSRLGIYMELDPGTYTVKSFYLRNQYVYLNVVKKADKAFVAFASLSTTTLQDYKHITVAEGEMIQIFKGATTGSNFVTVGNKIMISAGSTEYPYSPYENECPPIGYNIWDPENQKYVQVYAGFVNSNTRELYLRPVYKEYAGEELVGPWMSSLELYDEDTTPTEGAFVIDFGGELTSFEITPFMLQTLLDSLGIRQHFLDGASLLNSLMDQAQGRVRSEDELLHLSRPLTVIPIGDQLPAGLTFKPISKDVLPGLPGKFIR